MSLFPFGRHKMDTLSKVESGAIIGPFQWENMYTVNMLSVIWAVWNLHKKLLLIYSAHICIISILNFWVLCSCLYWIVVCFCLATAPPAINHVFFHPSCEILYWPNFLIRVFLAHDILVFMHSVLICLDGAPITWVTINCVHDAATWMQINYQTILSYIIAFQFLLILTKHPQDVTLVEQNSYCLEASICIRDLI